MNLISQRLQLLEAGYSPLPLIGKRPVLEGWQYHYANAEEIQAWSTKWPNATNTGILTKDTPILDLDILNETAAEAASRLVEARYNEEPVLIRIGRPPKRAIPFRTSNPFDKITALLLAPGEPEGARPEQRIEFLCDGQQAVVYGIHPDTRQPYRWNCPIGETAKHDDLPSIDEKEAKELVADIVELLTKEHGYRLVDAKGRPPGEDREALGNGHGAGGRFGWATPNDLIDHDLLVQHAARLIASHMEPGAAFNLLKMEIESLTGVDENRRQRRLSELHAIIDSAKSKIGKNGNEPTPILETGLEFAQSFKTPNYLIDRLIVQGYLYAMTGKTGSGKTAIAMPLAINVSLGQPFAGLETAQQRSIYLAAENPTDIQLRWIALGKCMLLDLATTPIFFIRNVFKISKMKSALLQEIARVGGEFGLIIVDTGPSFFEGVDANDRVGQLAHAKMFRELIDIIPGRPAVIVLCHPNKYAAEDGLIPAGGGTFLNEIDGNLTVSKKDTTIEMHWLGKWRGIEFAPLNFLLKPVVDLVDINGRPMSTIISEWITDQTQEDLEQARYAEHNEILTIISQNPKISERQLGARMRRKTGNLETDKTRARRATKEMVQRKIIRKNTALNRWDITESGMILLASLNPEVEKQDDAT